MSGIESTRWQPFYLNAIKNRNSVSTNSLAITDVIFGENIQFILLMNYMVDEEWLVSECIDIIGKTPTLILHGERGGVESMGLPSIVSSKVDLGPETYGTHHTKMMLLFYNHGIRVAIGTANLLERDYYLKTQSTFVQDFPLKASSRERHTNNSEFGADLLAYLREVTPMSSKAQKILQERVIDKLGDYDFSDAEVTLIGSVPGRHVASNYRGVKSANWGHLKLRKIFASRRSSSSVADLDSASRLSIQISSIGSMGKEEKFIEELAVSFHVKPDHVDIIWPTVDLIKNSFEGYQAGGSVPCNAATIFEKNGAGPLKAGFQRRFCVWEANSEATDFRRAPPHIKSYCQYFATTTSRSSPATHGAHKSATSAPSSINKPLSGGTRVSSAADSFIYEVSDSSDDDCLSAQVKKRRRRSDVKSDDGSADRLERNMKSNDEKETPEKSAFDKIVAHSSRSLAEPSSSGSQVGLGWYLLTSANLSQAAWGVLQKNSSVLHIKSFEMGVLFLPEKMKRNWRVFSCTPEHPTLGLTAADVLLEQQFQALPRSDVPEKRNFISSMQFERPSTASASGCGLLTSYLNEPIHFSIPYRLPPRRFEATDEPWVWDRPRLKPDCLGNLYGT